ncbi:hypothetical protein A9Q81_01130 [Gammaproteobacteria bacterium 42_54_T18]|nr:hypothetical protein A9Q81_01130 [Gammaproteobacteria bacterium 42_54_T18]
MTSFKGQHTPQSIILQCVRCFFNKAGINQFNDENNRRAKIRQYKYLNNIIEQDHRRIKRVTRPMLDFNNFHSARATLVGIEFMAMINKGQMKKIMSGSYAQL